MVLQNAVDLSRTIHYFKVKIQYCIKLLEYISNTVHNNQSIPSRSIYDLLLNQINKLENGYQSD